MIRSLLLASSALALTAGAASAATCSGLGTASISCTAPDSDPVTSAVDGAELVVSAGGSVVETAEDGTTIEMSGNDSAIFNYGTIENADTGNGGYAITGSGTPASDTFGLAVLNYGTISSGDRGIEMIGGSDLYVYNDAGAEIASRRQAVRSGQSGATVENAGTITATEGRAVQLRGNGASLTNTGTLMGGEEVVEARGDFTLVNSGTIKLVDESVEDEDGVQFASGTVTNSGVIRGTDDGIDMDEGLVVNTGSGSIVSIGDSSHGIDIDEIYEDEDGTRANGAVRIENAGLIEGWAAVGSDPAATNSVEIQNSGILYGRGGIAVNLAPGQGDSEIEILSGSVIDGDVLFGSGDDFVSVVTGFAGSLSDGLFDGGAGTDTAFFEAFALGNVQSFTLSSDVWTIALDNGTDALSGMFRNFEFWDLGGTSYTTAELRAALAPVPLPAGVLLLGSGLGLLALRRRG